MDAVAPSVLKLSEAKYLTLREGRNDFFSVVHHWDGNKLEISAHNHADPSRRISSISFERSGIVGMKIESKFIGGLSVWRELPGAYVAFAFDDFRLFLVHPGGGVSHQTLPWYTNADYDKGYQGIVDVQEILDSQNLIISVQRDSNPVLYDPESRSAIRKLELAHRHGNPHFKFRAIGAEFWVNDYDTIVKLDGLTLNVIASKRVQGVEGGMKQFAGEFSFCRADTLCLVARPFSGDVIGLDCANLNQTHRVSLGSQPIVAGLLGEDRVVALEWKTGEFRSARLM